MNVEHMVLYHFLFACLGMLPLMVSQRVRLTARANNTNLLRTFCPTSIPPYSRRCASLWAVMPAGKQNSPPRRAILLHDFCR
jgi:hypothetical protein